MFWKPRNGGHLVPYYPIFGERLRLVRDQSRASLQKTYGETLNLAGLWPLLPCTPMCRLVWGCRPMTSRPTYFSVTDVKRALKVARDFGMTVTGYEISSDGGIIVRTAEASDSSADAALERWMRGQNAQRHD